MVLMMVWLKETDSILVGSHRLFPRPEITAEDEAMVISNIFGLGGTASGFLLAIYRWKKFIKRCGSSTPVKS
ncbi:hypothetical protein K504DRAFT_461075 [Pleomassaria siparia CBS 279.74]|uniref:Uncharacterized protein n=1 Tax=Pleomassaria siparia CBS 279.74 TaxID=1314801 RepID=A0A6G1JW95_9PLEO|nr:hypothetical protein K504DRAFT_461075 [Pleomassaria siparia CBS 279.74]